jgi:hypothetical protein
LRVGEGDADGVAEAEKHGDHSPPKYEALPAAPPLADVEVVGSEHSQEQGEDERSHLGFALARLDVLRAQQLQERMLYRGPDGVEEEAGTDTKAAALKARRAGGIECEEERRPGVSKLNLQ